MPDNLQLATRRARKAPLKPGARVKAGTTVFIVGTLVDDIPAGAGNPPFLLVSLPRGTARGPGPVGDVIVPFGAVALP
jgi:hypothetical protein